MEVQEPLPYSELSFPEPAAERPYCYINMVATIDGKIITGERDEPVADLGSRNDQAVMRRIEAASDAVMIGAGSLRATPGLWYEPDIKRIVVSRSGDVDFRSRFFADAPEQAFIQTDASVQLPAGVRKLPLNLKESLLALRQLGVERLLFEGGSELNASVLREQLVDELFLTVAPKIKLGRNVPTYAGGEPLPRSDILNFSLVECHQVGDEVFLRYRTKGNQ